MPRIDTLMLAHHVEAQNGKLYISGGGWTDFSRPVPPEGTNLQPVPLGIAITVEVGWEETNIPFELKIVVETEDGQQIMSADGQLEVGRSPGLPPGAEQRSVLAMNAQIPLQAGGYRILASFSQQADPPRTISFRIHDTQMAP